MCLKLWCTDHLCADIKSCDVTHNASSKFNCHLVVWSFCFNPIELGFSLSDVTLHPHNTGVHYVAQHLPCLTSDISNNKIFPFSCFFFFFQIPFNKLGLLLRLDSVRITIDTVDLEETAVHTVHVPIQCNMCSNKCTCNSHRGRGAATGGYIIKHDS